MKRSFLFFFFVVLCFSAGAETITMGAPTENKELFDVLTKIYKDAGFDLKIEILPPARVYAQIDQGNMVGFLMAEDSLPKVFKTSVLKVGFGPDPLLQSKIVGWVRNQDLQKNLPKASWADLNVGYILGIQISKQFADLTGSKNLIQSNSFDSAARMLSAGRFDIVFVSEGTLETLAKGLNISPLPETVSLIKYWHVLPANMSGTPAEKKIRAAFLADRAAFEKAIQPKR